MSLQCRAVRTSAARGQPLLVPPGAAARQVDRQDVGSPRQQRLERPHLGTGTDEQRAVAGQSQPLRVVDDLTDRLGEGGLDEPGVDPGSELTAQLLAGDLATAREIHHRLIPVTNALMSTSQGAIMAKAALVELGVIEHAAVRLPYVEGPAEHLEIVRAGLAASGIGGAA